MSFDERLGELLDYPDDPPGHPEAPPAGLDPARIIRRARSRRNRRVAGTVAMTLAVAVVATLAVHAAGPDAGPPAPGGAAPWVTATTTPSPTPTATAPPPSPVRVLAAGERIQVTPDVELWVTATDKCTSVTYSAAPETTPATDCLDATGDNVRTDGPDGRPARSNLPAQGSWQLGGPYVITGMYIGKGVPARIVATDHGRATTATIVTTPAMKDWAAFYVVLPDTLPDMHTAPPGGRPATPPAADPDSLTLAVYDAAGTLLTGTASPPS
ncbi:hypothetical protein ACFXKJ_28265 [Kitasatospora indigofera]|uniref:hypothetical protein n=1 Tax=Kitasatospora indigofera TaxID=67307 RepID=UPI0036B35295